MHKPLENLDTKQDLEADDYPHPGRIEAIQQGRLREQFLQGIPNDRLRGAGGNGQESFEQDQPVEEKPQNLGGRIIDRIIQEVEETIFTEPGS